MVQGSYSGGRLSFSPLVFHHALSPLGQLTNQLILCTDPLQVIKCFSAVSQIIALPLFMYNNLIHSSGQPKNLKRKCDHETVKFNPSTLSTYTTGLNSVACVCFKTVSLSTPQNKEMETF